MSASTIAELADDLSSRSDQLLAQFVSAWETPAKSLRELGADFQRLQQQLDAREVRRRERTANTADLPELQQKLASGRVGELTVRERRKIVAHFEHFSPAHVATLLRANEALWRRFTRAILMAWGRSDIPTWDRFVQLSGEAPETAWGLSSGFPFSGPKLLGADGPSRVAALLAVRPLPALLDELESSRLRPTWEITGQIAADWLREQARRRSRQDATASCLLTDPRCTGWFPSSPKETRVGSSLRSQAEVIAAALECRRAGVFSDADVQRLDERLLTPGSSFGDPRLGASAGWLQVKTLSPQAFDEFLASLIREDLQFFFDKAMHEPDRREFWLRYLGSIRQTLCVLDRTTWNSLSKQSAALPPALRSAFRRSIRFDRDGDVSAFCLFFDQHVVVEFSKTGNASYVYPRKIFDEVIRRERFYDVSSLKNKERASTRLFHQGGWQYRFDQELRDLGIFRDGWRHTRVG